MLFVVLLGGAHPKANIELHDIAFALGDSLVETYDQLRAAWFASPRHVHIDGWMEVEGVDGYRIEWRSETAPTDEPRLYFVHLGGYESGFFGEAHEHLLVAALNATEAKQKAKAKLSKPWQSPHTDALFEVAGCIPSEVAHGLHLRLVPGEYKENVVHSEYVVME
ncbi:DUF1543 domain-containing protein [Telmatobacter bradus]|uniref:DUF1543 domain-containing protein n=1 Tax=Telmatobacter bradus TaxID=474953 RepID=UPI003B42DB65